MSLSKRIRFSSITFGLILSTISPLQSAQCDGQGTLRFLGTISDGSSSVWLSTTTSGSFTLNAAQGNQTVDTWTKEQSGLHLSRSPIVSSGNGGVHKLYSGQNCLLDSSNQQGGIALPPSIIPPGVKPVPPIAVLPPEFAKPVPPIAVLPPDGGAVVPPIAVLPPDGGAVVPPIAVLPPEIPTGLLADNITTAQEKVVLPHLPCEMDTNASSRADCYRKTVPLTQGREFDTVNLWNFWVNANYTHTKDERHLFQTTSDSRSLSIGGDKLMNSDTTAGLQLIFNRGDNSSFGGEMQIDTSSYIVSPYMTYRFHPQWLAYASLGIGQQSLDEQILTLDGHSKATLFSANFEIQGYYPQSNDIILRPKIQTSYTYQGSDDYQLSGTLVNQFVTINTHNDSLNYGIVQGSMELSRVFYINSSPILPYIEGGIFRQYDDQDVQWGGLVRAGIRQAINKRWMTSMDMGYESIGIHDLDVFNIQMLVSYAF